MSFNKNTALVVVADQFSAFRQHLTGLLRKSVEHDIRVIECHSGQELINFALTESPDLIVTDFILEGTNGLQAAEKIWLAKPEAKILFWTQSYGESYLRDMNRIVSADGLHGFVPKNAREEVLMYAIEALLFYGHPYIDSSVRNVSVRLENKTYALTDAEYDTLKDIALGLTDKALAMKHQLSVRGVQNRILTMTRKLMRDSAPKPAKIAGMEVFNLRNRLVLEALKRGLIDLKEISNRDEQLSSWLSTQATSYEASHF